MHKAFHVLLWGVILYYAITAIGTAILLVLVLLWLLWIATIGRYRSNNERAFNRIRVTSRTYASTEEVLRNIVFSRDPTITDGNREWARRALDNLGHPIIELPPGPRLREKPDGNLRVVR